MPSPVGHALAGYAAGTLVAGRPPSRSSAPLSSVPARIVLFAGLGCLPDIDFLFGTHSTYTHSVGAALIVAAVAAVAIRKPLSLVAACPIAYASHLVLDWLSRDTNPPLGIMMLWPFSREYYMAPWPIIEPVSRRYHWEYFWSHNLKVVSLEILIFGSLALAVHLWRGRSRGVDPA
jgi:membrane-bound metal-dependent hydrolase YbcI (DUF457 family)